jgi:hypothetical protein
VVGEAADLTVQLPYGRHHHRDLVIRPSPQVIPYKLLLFVQDNIKLGLGSIQYACLGSFLGPSQVLLETPTRFSQLLHMFIALSELLLGRLEQCSQLDNFLRILIDDHLPTRIISGVL